MKKLLIFHSALAPYRVDFFNMLGEHYDCTVVFLSRNNRNQNFDQERLLSGSKIKYTYFDRKLVIGGRDVNFGYLHYLRKYTPDIVIGGEYGLPVLAPWLWKKIFHLHYSLYTICDDSLDIARECSGVRSRLRSFLLPKLDGLIFTTTEVAKYYREKLGAKCTLTFPIIQKDQKYQATLKRLLPVSARLECEYELAGKRVFLFVGRLTGVKNLPFLLSTFAQLDAEDTRLVVVGDGDLKDSLRKQVEDLGIADRVTLAGRYEGDNLYAWYNIADLFILPSTYEPFGAVVAEALQAGCPVACTTVAGSSSLILNGVNGERFNPHEGNELLSIMQKYVSIPVRTNKAIVRHSLLQDSFDECAEKLREGLI